MAELVHYEQIGKVARIALDDGKANALGPALLDRMEGALDRAEKEASAVVLTGRPGRFSAGFDLSVLGAGGPPARALVTRGAEVALRLIDFPRPVVAACNGHAITMGAVLLMSVDFRVGTHGAFKIGLNEVALGMTLPHFARELARARLSKRHLLRAAVHAELYAPEAAVDAGFLDAAVSPEALDETAQGHAERLGALHAGALKATRRGILTDVVREIRERLTDDIASLVPDA